MGYTTEFNGSFDLKFNNPETKKHVIELIDGLSTTRRMKRDLSKIKDKLEHNVEYYGIEGEFYYVEDGNSGQNRDPSILEYNNPPSTQPGLWLQWVIGDNLDTLEWDGNEKFYYYTEWLEYLIEKIFKPNNVSITGSVDYRGEKWDDNGTITILNNTVITP